MTLQEAYQFASEETLARTERTRGGPQHAAYEFDLAGTGEMVVTDVRTTQASLVLAADLAGRISVREAGGALVAELRKTAGSTIELGVEAGSYVIAMDAGAGRIFEASTTLASGEHADLAKLSFHPGKPVEIAVARGDGPADAVTGAGPAVTAEVVAAPPHSHVGSKLGIIPREGDERIDVTGLSFSFVGDRVGHIKGAQLALGWTQADSGVNGLQLAIGATIASGDSRGAQLAEGITWSDGSFRGAQLGGLAAISRGETRGLQMGGIATYATGRLRGLQMAGIAAVTDGDAAGVQMSGIVTAARRSRGLQMSGIVAAADDEAGLQMSVVNVARTQRGMQLGVTNVVDEGAGFRLGVVNVARRTRGFQLGLVNVAGEDDGESFALFNFIGNGIHDVAAYASDTMLTNLAFKLGGRHLYTSLGAGYQPGDTVPAGTMSISRSGARWCSTAGVGWRFPLHADRLEALEVEANTSNVWRAWSASGDPATVNALRVTALVRLAPHVSLLAGVSGNVVIGQGGRDLDLSLGGPERVIHDGGTTVRIYPGFVVGLQI